MRSRMRRWAQALPHRQAFILAAKIDAPNRAPREMVSSDRASEDSDGGEQLRHDVELVLQGELPQDLRTLFGIEVKVAILGSRSGSLVVFFSAIFAGLGMIASYKDLYDSVHLLREHAHLLLNALLDRRYGAYDLRVAVDLKYPRLTEPFESSSQKRLGPFSSDSGSLVASAAAGLPAGGRTQRDGFFWFLLVLCVVLLGVVGLLVYGAVVSTYFPPL